MIAWSMNFYELNYITKSNRALELSQRASLLPGLIVITDDSKVHPTRTLFQLNA